MQFGKFMPYLVAAIPGGLIATLVALPFSPSIYWLIFYGHQCFDGSGFASIQSASMCLADSMMGAPGAALIGPLAHDDEPAPDVWPGIFLTAFIIGASFAVIRAYRAFSKSASR